MLKIEWIFPVGALIHRGNEFFLLNGGKSNWRHASHISAKSGKIFDLALIREFRYAAFKLWKAFRFSMKIILNWLYFAV